jgi:biotin carboxyl carrier protein
MEKKKVKHFDIVLEGKSYQVAIENPNANPIRVTVDGEAFDVQVKALAGAPAVQALPASPGVAPQSSPAPAHVDMSGRIIKAPMPGTINKVSVKPGDHVSHGQELCVLEAMKMNNTIRAPGAGQIAEVHVTVKQSVQHGDILIVFAN